MDTWSSIADSLSPLGRNVAGSSTATTYFFDSVRRCRSQKELDAIVKQEVALLEQRLSKPASQGSTKENLIRCIYCHLMGHNVSFAAIHAVKLAQQGQLLQKRLGYLACVLLLEENDDLVIMLVNTIQKDLQSSNIVDNLCALTAASSLVSAEMIPAILPLVLTKLQHPKVHIRKRSVLTLHGFLQKAPDLMQHSADQFKQVLCDKSPDVMWPAVLIYYDLIKENTSPYKDATKSLVFILRQVIQRSLPAEFDFRDVPSPWLQIYLLQCLAMLGKDDENTSAEICPVLEELLQKTDPQERVGLAIIHECVVTIATVRATPTLLETAAKCVSKFLSARRINLKYLGLRLLALIVKINPSYSLPHQQVVIECLDHPDLAIRRKVLDILFMMTNESNVKVVCQKLMENLQSSTDPYIRSDILNKLLQLTQCHSRDILWYVNTMNSMMLLIGEQTTPGDVTASITTTIRNHSNQSSSSSTTKMDAIVTAYWSLMRTKTIPDALLRVTAWVVGEYFQYSSLPVTDIMRGLYICLTKDACSPTTAGTILSAMTKIVCGSQTTVEVDLERIKPYIDPTDNLLKQSALELSLLSERNYLIAKCAAVNIDNEQLDSTLSVLDDYVCLCLEAGAAPYKPQILRLSPQTSVLPAGYAGVNFRPYESPAPSMASSLSGKLDILSTCSPGERFGDGSLTLPSVKKIWNRDGVAPSGKSVSAPATPASDTPISSICDESAAIAESAAVAVMKSEELKRRELAEALFTGIENLDNS